VKTELIDFMGDDLTVVNAARVSFDKESDWESITPAGPIKNLLTEKDTKLINYLARHNHFTPFTHCTVTMRETVPIFVARQRFKHTIGFSYNEVSRRYVDDIPEFYMPAEWRARADNAKQGSSQETIDINPVGERPPPMVDIYKLSIKNSLWTYEELLRKGVCPEQARMVLPQSMYTSYYVTGSLYAWARAYNLRSDSHAQKEIQQLADQWNRICIGRFPTSWEALTNE
jgi:thymidylate synthase (FAD)